MYVPKYFHTKNTRKTTVYLMPTSSVLWGLRDSCTYLCKHTSDKKWEEFVALGWQVSQKKLKMP